MFQACVKWAARKSRASSLFVCSWFLAHHVVLNRAVVSLSKFQACLFLRWNCNHQKFLINVGFPPSMRCGRAGGLLAAPSEPFCSGRWVKLEGAWLGLFPEQQVCGPGWVCIHSVCFEFCFYWLKQCLRSSCALWTQLLCPSVPPCLGREECMLFVQGKCLADFWGANSGLCKTSKHQISAERRWPFFLLS